MQWDAAYHGTRTYNCVYATKGAFLHRKYHELFFDDHRFDDVRTAVNSYVTGEDMLMCFAFAMNAKAPRPRAVAIRTGYDFWMQWDHPSLNYSRKRRADIERMLLDVHKSDGLPLPNRNDWCGIPVDTVSGKFVCDTSLKLMT